jgi:DNA repair photolyase
MQEVDENSAPIDADRRRGRGAVSNRSGRFERAQRVEQSDGWDIPEARAAFRTTVTLEQARRIVSYNRSPDLPFDRSINPYRGCEHGCVYCFARPTHAWLGLSAGLVFETRLIARPNAAACLDRELRQARYKPAPIAIGTNTDPYQPIEKEHEITRDCLKVLRDFGHLVAIVTKGTLIERDIDILAPMAARGLVRVGVSVTSLDSKIARTMEPRVPSAERKLQMIARLSAAGIPVRLMVSPIVPALTDPELEEILAAGYLAGARTASWIMLRLPLEVSQVFQEWLAAHFPDRAARVLARLREMHGGQLYDAAWHRRMRGEGPYAQMIAQRFDLACKRIGFSRDVPRLRCDLFSPPLRRGDQMALF